MQKILTPVMPGIILKMDGVANDIRICERGDRLLLSFRHNKSAARVVDILTMVAQSASSVTIAEIARALAIPKSSTFEIVYTLVDKGFLEIDTANGNAFKLGVKLFAVGSAFLAKADLHRTARPQMEHLMTQTGRTVFLAIESNGLVLYLDKLEPCSAIYTGAILGSTNPMHCTALGKSLLAAYQEEKVRTITGGGELPAKTPNTITCYQDLLGELAKVRQRGYAIDNQENEMDILCVAAPIYDRQGNPVAAVSVASPAAAMHDAEVERIGQMVTARALLISRHLGFLGQGLYQ